MRVGVVIPAYNAAPWIGDAIRSLLAQTYENWRLVIVDDGSTDKTGDIAAGFMDSRIRLVRQPNAGVSAARNLGVTQLEADSVCFLDADDWLAPDAVQRLVGALLASPRAVAAAGAFAFIDHGARVGQSRRPPKGDILPQLLRRNCFANGGQLLIDRAAIRQAGPFRVDLSFGEDWDYWIRLALLGDFIGVSGRKPVLFVRRHPGSVYDRRATDPAAFLPCLEAIFGNPDLQARLGTHAAFRLRARAEHEIGWIVGRECLRHGELSRGRACLRRAWCAQPSMRRAVLLLAAHAPVLQRILHLCPVS